MDGQQSPVSIASSRNLSTTGPSTPPDLYVNNHASPNLGMSVLPSIANSRPSTANTHSPYVVKSSHAFAQPNVAGHQFHYSAPDMSAARPSTANSQGILSHPHYSPNLHHSATVNAHAYRHSPAQGQIALENSSFDGGLSATNIASFSRPSTAGSVSIGAASPSQMPVNIDADAWCQAVSPAMRATHGQGTALQSGEGYFPPSVHSTPQHSRPHSPWAC